MRVELVTAALPVPVLVGEWCTRGEAGLRYLWTVSLARCPSARRAVSGSVQAARFHTRCE